MIIKVNILGFFFQNTYLHNTTKNGNSRLPYQKNPRYSDLPEYQGPNLQQALHIQRHIPNLLSESDSSNNKQHSYHSETTED